MTHRLRWPRSVAGWIVVAFVAFAAVAVVASLFITAGPTH
jgi:hypothetical protein